MHYHRCIYPQISASFVGILQYYLERSWWNIVRKKGFAAKHAWSDLEAAATRHKDRFICNTAESFVLSSTEKTREKPKVETFEGGTFFLCLFFFFSFSSCSFFLSLCTYSYTHAHIYMYTPRLSEEKTDPLVLSARNAGQEVAKNCRRVQRKLGCKREWRRSERGGRRGEAKKAIRPSRLSAEKKCFRGEIVLRFLGILIPFWSCCFFLFLSSYFFFFFLLISARNVVVEWESLFC